MDFSPSWQVNKEDSGEEREKAEKWREAGAGEVKATAEPVEGLVKML